MKIGSLFSGAGMLDAGVQVALGGTVAWHCENDPAASKLLAHHWPGVPNHGDITQVDWTTVEPVDVLTGGFPCQDMSLAGARAGMHGHTRSGLWAEYARAIAELRPSLVVIENVRGLLSAEAASDMEPCPWCLGDEPGEPVLRALGAVLGDLAGLGYDTEWCGLRAGDVGAPHGRFRVFIVAHPGGEHSLERRQPAPRQTPRRWAFGEPAGRGGAPAADAACLNGERSLRTGASGERPETQAGDDIGAAADTAQPERRGPEQPHLGTPTRRTAEPRERPSPTAAPADTPSERWAGGSGAQPDLELYRPEPAHPSTQWGTYGPAIQRWERLTRPAPPPTTAGPKGGQRLNPDFTDWMMGWPNHWTDIPGLTRNDRLRICGNGVVPQQAAAALRFLLAVERAA